MKFTVDHEKVYYPGYNNHTLVGELFKPQSPHSCPGILFCHGICTSRAEFREFAEKLSSRGLLVLIFDYSGHGESQGTRSLFTSASHREDTLASIARLKKEQPSAITVLGHSFGVKAALDAGVSSEAVDKVILVAPRGRSGGGLKGFRRLAFRAIGLGYAILPFLPDIYLDCPRTPTEKISLRLTRYANSINNLEVAQQLEKPCLTIAGLHDHDVTVKDALEVFHGLKHPQKNWLLLENSGHSPFNEADQELLLGEIAQFCGNAP